LGDRVIAADRAGDIAWTVLAFGSNDTHHELFTYSPVTGTYSQLPMRGADDVGSLGLLGISKRWIVFAVMKNLFDGSDWRIVARSRVTGKERVIAHGVPGGALSAQFSLDGDTVVWAQPDAETTQMLDLNLITDKSRILDSAPSRTNAYDWVKASNGHVVWEWGHSVGRANASDILETSESGGKVVHVTTDGKGSQPSLSWPWVAYSRRFRFGSGGNVVIHNLLNRTTIQLPSTVGADYPQIGGSLVTWSPEGHGYLGLYSVPNRRLVLMTHQRQMTIDGQGLYYPAVAPGTMADLGTNARKVNGVWVESEFHLIILNFHGSHPFHQILGCV